jgi:anthranilate synthase component II
MKTVILDNYDSFTFNLYQYLGELGECPLVFRNDRVTLDGLRDVAPDRIIISPGPGSPDDDSYFGVCRRAILELGRTVPVLGVCLGHQGIVHAFGGRIVRAKRPMHGKAALIRHTGAGVLRGLPRPFEGMLYHSLAADPDAVPACLEVTAWADDGTVMAVRHRALPIHGVQFHPESVGTPQGKQVLANFLSSPPPRKGRPGRVPVGAAQSLPAALPRTQ